MDIITQILAFFGNYTPVVSFVGAIVGGEETLVLLTILAARGALNTWYVVLFFYIGTIFSDSIWYFFGKSPVFNWLMRRRFFADSYNKWGTLLDNATKQNDLQALFTTKFLYGFRLPTIVYLARERLSFKKFVSYSLLTNGVWVAVIATFGWLSGKGVALISYFSHNIIVDVFSVGLVIIFFIGITRVISRYTKIWLQNR